MASSNAELSAALPENRRILVVDQLPAIHDYLRLSLQRNIDTSAGHHNVSGAGEQSEGDGNATRLRYEIDSAYQMEEALRKVKHSRAEGRPYALVFVEAGGAGLQILQEIWRVDADVHAVICSDLSAESRLTPTQFGDADRVLILRKPLDRIEVQQFAAALTTKWRLQSQVRLMMNRLNQLVEVRTAEIARAHADLLALNRKLEAAKAASEEANQAKSAFLATMSHEIRTPMTAILGFADYLLEEGDLRQAPRERIDAINTIVRNGRHLLQVINDILDLTKIEANRIEVERIPCQPLSVALDVVSLIRGRAEEKRLALTLDVDGEIPETIHSDPTRIRQILVNLLGNAIKFTQRGSIRLTLRMLRDRPEPYLQFEIRDTGIGMNAKQIRKLFQPFTQADTSMTRKYGGTGLGLCICKRLAEMLGGDVTVTSEVGVGSTFLVSIATGPLDNGKALTLDTLSRTEPDAIEEAESRRALVQLTGRALIAEDGPDNQRLLAHLLSKAGAEVTVVENGKLAVERIVADAQCGKPFDIVLMDMQMPVLDGYAATRQLRELGYNLPIIALTAFAMTGDREICLATGCTEYLTKPIDRALLFPLVFRYMEQSRREDSSSSARAV